MDVFDYPEGSLESEIGDIDITVRGGGAKIGKFMKQNKKKPQSTLWESKEI
mgnify:CR=1 FL=1